MVMFPSALTVVSCSARCILLYPSRTWRFSVKYFRRKTSACSRTLDGVYTDVKACSICNVSLITIQNAIWSIHQTIDFTFRFCTLYGYCKHHVHHIKPQDVKIPVLFYFLQFIWLKRWLKFHLMIALPFWPMIIVWGWAISLRPSHNKTLHFQSLSSFFLVQFLKVSFPRCLGIQMRGHSLGASWLAPSIACINCQGGTRPRGVPVFSTHSLLPMSPQPIRMRGVNRD